MALQALLKIRTESMDAGPDNSPKRGLPEQATVAPSPQMSAASPPPFATPQVHSIGGIQAPIGSVPAILRPSPTGYGTLLPSPLLPGHAISVVSSSVPGMLEPKDPGQKKRRKSQTDSAPNQQTESETQATIRQDQIEAALRSKPQRGRKRENLSVLERLELTRTRNREHAKSTRIRKKARYQELLDKETKLENLQKINNLTSLRKDAVVKFVALIGSALSSQIVSKDKVFEVIDNSSRFFFEVNGAKTQGSHDNLQPMYNVLCAKVAQQIGMETLPDLVLGINGGSANVAVNEPGNGFAEVSCFSSHSDGRISVESVMRFQFANQSTKLTSVRFTLIPQEYSNGPSDDQPSASSSSSESLGCQKSYPSVVSLDPAHALPDGRQGESCNREGDCNIGPGMSI